VAEFGGHMRTDSSLHATYRVAEWPGWEASSTFLCPLLLRMRFTASSP